MKYTVKKCKPSNQGRAGAYLTLNTVNIESLRSCGTPQMAAPTGFPGSGPSSLPENFTFWATLTHPGDSTNGFIVMDTTREV